MILVLPVPDSPTSTTFIDCISSDDEEMKTYILSLFDHIIAYAFYDSDYQLPDFGHNIHQIFDDWNDNNVLIVTNYLQNIKQSLENIIYTVFTIAYSNIIAVIGVPVIAFFIE